MSSLERALKGLQRKLTELFLYLYVPPRPLTPPVLAALASTANMFRQHLGDYREYLAVKAQRNITMTTYPCLAKLVL